MDLMLLNEQPKGSGGGPSSSSSSSSSSTVGPVSTWHTSSSSSNPPQITSISNISDHSNNQNSNRQSGAFGDLYNMVMSAAPHLTNVVTSTLDRSTKQQQQHPLTVETVWDDEDMEALALASKIAAQAAMEEEELLTKAKSETRVLTSTSALESSQLSPEQIAALLAVKLVPDDAPLIKDDDLVITKAEVKMVSTPPSTSETSSIQRSSSKKSVASSSSPSSAPSKLSIKESMARNAIFQVASKMGLKKKSSPSSRSKSPVAVAAEPPPPPLPEKDYVPPVPATVAASSPASTPPQTHSQQLNTTPSPQPISQQKQQTVVPTTVAAAIVSSSPKPAIVPVSQSPPTHHTSTTPIPEAPQDIITPTNPPERFSSKASWAYNASRNGEDLHMEGQLVDMYGNGVPPTPKAQMAMAALEAAMLESYKLATPAITPAASSHALATQQQTADAVVAPVPVQQSTTTAHATTNAAATSSASTRAAEAVPTNTYSPVTYTPQKKKRNLKNRASVMTVSHLIAELEICINDIDEGKDAWEVTENLYDYYGDAEVVVLDDSTSSVTGTVQAISATGAPPQQQTAALATSSIPAAAVASGISSSVPTAPPPSKETTERTSLLNAAGGTSGPGAAAPQKTKEEEEEIAKLAATLEFKLTQLALRLQQQEDAPADSATPPVEPAAAGVSSLVFPPRFTSFETEKSPAYLIDLLRKAGIPIRTGTSEIMSPVSPIIPPNTITVAPEPSEMVSPVRPYPPAGVMRVTNNHNRHVSDSPSAYQVSVASTTSRSMTNPSVHNAEVVEQDYNTWAELDELAAELRQFVPPASIQRQAHSSIGRSAITTRKGISPPPPASSAEAVENDEELFNDAVGKDGTSTKRQVPTKARLMLGIELDSHGDVPDKAQKILGIAKPASSVTPTHSTGSAPHAAPNSGSIASPTDRPSIEARSNEPETPTHAPTKAQKLLGVGQKKPTSPGAVLELEATEPSLAPNKAQRLLGVGGSGRPESSMRKSEDSSSADLNVENAPALPNKAHRVLGVRPESRTRRSEDSSLHGMDIDLTDTPPLPNMTAKAQRVLGVVEGSPGPSSGSKERISMERDGSQGPSNPPSRAPSKAQRLLGVRDAGSKYADDPLPHLDMSTREAELAKGNNIASKALKLLTAGSRELTNPGPPTSLTSANTVVARPDTYDPLDSVVLGSFGLNSGSKAASRNKAKDPYDIDFSERSRGKSLDMDRLDEDEDLMPRRGRSMRKDVPASPVMNAYGQMDRPTTAPISSPSDGPGYYNRATANSDGFGTHETMSNLSRRLRDASATRASNEVKLLQLIQSVDDPPVMSATLTRYVKQDMFKKFRKEYYVLSKLRRRLFAFKSTGIDETSISFMPINAGTVIRKATLAGVTALRGKHGFEIEGDEEDEMSIGVTSSSSGSGRKVWTLLLDTIAERNMWMDEIQKVINWCMSGPPRSEFGEPINNSPRLVRSNISEESMGYPTSAMATGTPSSSGGFNNSYPRQPDPRQPVYTGRNLGGPMQRSNSVFTSTQQQFMQSQQPRVPSNSTSSYGGSFRSGMAPDMPRMERTQTMHGMGSSQSMEYSPVLRPGPATRGSEQYSRSDMLTMMAPTAPVMVRSSTMPTQNYSGYTGITQHGSNMMPNPSGNSVAAAPPSSVGGYPTSVTHAPVPSVAGLSVGGAGAGEPDLSALTAGNSKDPEGLMRMLESQILATQIQQQKILLAQQQLLAAALQQQQAGAGSDLDMMSRRVSTLGALNSMQTNGGVPSANIVYTTPRVMGMNSSIEPISPVGGLGRMPSNESFGGAIHVGGPPPMSMPAFPMPDYHSQQYQQQQQQQRWH